MVFFRIFTKIEQTVNGTSGLKMDVCRNLNSQELRILRKIKFQEARYKYPPYTILTRGAGMTRMTLCQSPK